MAALLGAGCSDRSGHCIHRRQETQYVSLLKSGYCLPLVSFACASARQNKVVSTEFKPEARWCWRAAHHRSRDRLPLLSLKANYKIVEDTQSKGMVASACCSVGYGIAEALFKMGLGNHIDFKMRG